MGGREGGKYRVYCVPSPLMHVASRDLACLAFFFIVINNNIRFKLNKKF